MQKIMIDGVNVDECKLYDCGTCNSEQVPSLNCNDNPNCYFKQLQRLKAENERLKKQLEIYDEEDITVQISQNQLEEYTRLKAENEKLKDCLRLLETNLTIIRHDFLTCMSECLAALNDESEVEQ